MYLRSFQQIVTSYSQSPQDLQKQIEEHQNQLKELETDILLRKHSPKYAAEQLDKILALQDHLKSLKKSQREIDFNEEGVLSPKYLSGLKASAAKYQSPFELSKTGGKMKGNIHWKFCFQLCVRSILFGEIT